MYGKRIRITTESTHNTGVKFYRISLETGKFIILNQNELESLCRELEKIVNVKKNTPYNR